MCFIGGLIEGLNYSTIDNRQYIDLDKCEDLIIVHRRYFLRNFSLIYSWAQKVEHDTMTIKQIK